MVVPSRVVVAPLENRTGNPALEAVGSMVAEWVTQGLLRTGLVQVVDARTMLETARDAGPSRGDDYLRTLAERTGAGTVVSGSYFIEGDQLRFLMRITGAPSGEVRHTVDVVNAPIARPTGSPRTAPAAHHGRARRAAGSASQQLDGAHEPAADVRGIRRVLAGNGDVRPGLRELGAAFHPRRAARLHLLAGVALGRDGDRESSSLRDRRFALSYPRSQSRATWRPTTRRTSTISTPGSCVATGRCRIVARGEWWSSRRVLPTPSMQPA